MEDLLREAGYKETRIFTPETDKIERGRDEGSRTASRVGAVVEYLAGWVPGMNRSQEHLTPEEAKGDAIQARSMPPSPLAGRTKALPSDPTYPKDPSSLLSSSRHGSPRTGRGRLSLPPDQQLRPQPSASESLRAYAQISAAQGYLRHMSSTPNINKDQRSVPHKDALDMMSRRPYSTDSANEQHPPLPSNWLDSVSKAVLGAPSAGAHVGQPRPSNRAQAPRAQHRTHSQLALTDHTNKVRPMGSLRSQTAPGAVNTAVVVCRSAPSSRSSSRVGERLTYVTDRMGKPRRASRSGFPRRPQGEDRDSVPSLASTLLENDSCSPQWIDGKRIPSGSGEDWDSEEDEDDGELDLAQLLVPPKRQKSIRSLRQHLHRSESARGLRNPSLRPLEPYILDDDDNSSASTRSRDRRTHRWTSSDEGSGLEFLGMPGMDQPGAKRRRGLPVAWSSLASGR